MEFATFFYILITDKSTAEAIVMLNTLPLPCHFS